MADPKYKLPKEALADLNEYVKLDELGDFGAEHTGTQWDGMIKNAFKKGCKNENSTGKITVDQKTHDVFAAKDDPRECPPVGTPYDEFKNAAAQALNTSEMLNKQHQEKQETLAGFASEQDELAEKLAQKQEAARNNKLKKLLPKMQKGKFLQLSPIMGIIATILMGKSKVSKEEGQAIFKDLAGGVLGMATCGLLGDPSRFAKGMDKWLRAVGNDPDAKEDILTIKKAIEDLQRKQDVYVESLENKFFPSEAAELEPISGEELAKLKLERDEAVEELNETVEKLKDKNPKSEEVEVLIGDIENSLVEYNDISNNRDDYTDTQDLNDSPSPGSNL